MKKKIILVLLFVFVFTGCASTGWQESGVSKKDGVTVKLEQQRKDGRPVEKNFSHPADDIDSALLSRLFGDLTYTESAVLGGKEKEPIFREDEIEKLAPAAAEALGKADSTQRIHFTSYKFTTKFALKQRRLTEGVIFLDENGKLNVAFSWINQRVDVHDGPVVRDEAVSREPLETDNTRKKVTADVSYLRRADIKNGKKAPMWVKADPDELPRTEMAAEPEESGTEQKEEKASRPEYEQKSADDAEERKDEIRSRLKYLKELHEDGLITESEYEDKRQEVLDELQ